MDKPLQVSLTKRGLPQSGSWQDISEYDENIVDDDDESFEPDHDCDECDSSGHCDNCCEMGCCTTKNPYSRQGQYMTDEGTYFPCTICESEHNGEPQPIYK